jgi:hypothetical protein
MWRSFWLTHGRSCIPEVLCQQWLTLAKHLFSSFIRLCSSKPESCLAANGPCVGNLDYAIRICRHIGDSHCHD